MNTNQQSKGGKTGVAETFKAITEALDGDCIAAFLFCKKFEGQTMVIPSKQHNNYMAELMLRHNYEKKTVMEVTEVSERTIYRILKNIAGVNDGKETN